MKRLSYLAVTAVAFGLFVIGCGKSPSSVEVSPSEQPEVSSLAKDGGLASANAPATYTFFGGHLKTTGDRAWDSSARRIFVPFNDDASDDEEEEAEHDQEDRHLNEDAPDDEEEKVEHDQEDQHFNVDASGLTMIVYGLDMSGIEYQGDMGWPPDPTDKGAFVQVGVRGLPPRQDNSVWYNVLSNMAGGKRAWDGSGPYTNSDGYRSYLFQGWYDPRGATGQTGPLGNSQYNAESYVVPAPAGTGSPSDYNKIDLKLEITPTGSPGVYKVIAYHRLQRAASFDEGVTWDHWNPAGNDPNPAHRGFIQVFEGSWTTTGVDLSRAFPFIQITNWAYASGPYRVSWDKVEITGTLFDEDD